MPLVLFNIGWMKYYRGQTQSDRIFNGGKYVKDNETGSEIRNFEPVDGWCYGYVSAPRRTINMKRLPDTPPGSGPRQSDPARRARVEKAAIEHVVAYYHRYECVSVEPENKGWDLEFTRKDKKLLVEVKGRSGDDGQVELTPHEYAAMCNPENRGVYRLAIVTCALDEPRLSIVKFHESDQTWRDQNDREVSLKERTGVQVRVA